MGYSGVITCNFCGTTSEELKKQKKAFYSDLFCSCRCARDFNPSSAVAQSSASQNSLSHRQLAVALKVSTARISQLIKSGMPHHSISAAVEWRTQNSRKTGPKRKIPCCPNDRSSDEAAVAVFSAASVDEAAVDVVDAASVDEAAVDVVDAASVEEAAVAVVDAASVDVAAGALN
jgi:hypothetical protein